MEQEKTNKINKINKKILGIFIFLIIITTISIYRISQDYESPMPLTGRILMQDLTVDIIKIENVKYVNVTFLLDNNKINKDDFEDIIKKDKNFYLKEKEFKKYIKDDPFLYIKSKTKNNVVIAEQMMEKSDIFFIDLLYKLKILRLFLVFGLIIIGLFMTKNKKFKVVFKYIIILILFVILIFLGIFEYYNRFTILKF